MQSEPGAEPGLQAWHARALQGFEQRTESCRALLGELSAVDQLLWTLPPTGLETSTSCCESPALSYLPAGSECSAWKSQEAPCAPALGASVAAPASVLRVTQQVCTGTVVRPRSLGSGSYARLHLRPGAAQEQKRQQQQQLQATSFVCMADPRQPRDVSGSINSAASCAIDTKSSCDLQSRINRTGRLSSAKGIHNAGSSRKGGGRGLSGMARSSSSKSAAASGSHEDRDKNKFSRASTTRLNTSQTPRQPNKAHAGRVRSPSEKRTDFSKQSCHESQVPSKKAQAPLVKPSPKREAAKVRPVRQKQQKPAASSSKRLVKETFRTPLQDESDEVSFQGNAGRDQHQQTTLLDQDSTAVWSSCELAQEVREELNSLAEVASYAALTCQQTKPLAEVLRQQVSLQLMKLEEVMPHLQWPSTAEETRMQVSDIRDAARQARDTLQDALKTSQPIHGSREEMCEQSPVRQSTTSFSSTPSLTNVSTSSVLAAALGDLVLGMRQALDDIHKVRRCSAACDDHSCEYPLSILEE